MNKENEKLKEEKKIIVKSRNIFYDKFRSFIVRISIKHLQKNIHATNLSILKMEGILYVYTLHIMSVKN